MVQFFYKMSSEKMKNAFNQELTSGHDLLTYTIRELEGQLFVVQAMVAMVEAVFRKQHFTRILHSCYITVGHRSCIEAFDGASK